MAGMDIAERRRAQDGGFVVEGLAGPLTFRVSTLPAETGEKAVLRLLNPADAPEGLDALGMAENDLTRVRRLLSSRQGLLLISGPTGSGKEHHAVRRAERARPIDAERGYAGGSHRVPDPRRDPGAGQSRRRADVSDTPPVRYSDRTPTSSWWARCGTRRPHASRWQPRSRATSCCRPSIPWTRRRPSHASSTWECPTTSSRVD